MVLHPGAEMMRRAWPVLLFAAMLAVFERAAAGRWSCLPLWTILAYGVSTAALRLLPWRRALDRFGPCPPVMYLILVRRLTGVLSQEAGRVFRARSLCMTHRYGAGWFTSLTCATAAVLRRAVVRAERVYAALAVRGFE